MTYISPLKSLYLSILCQMSGYVCGNVFLYLHLNTQIHIIAHAITAFLLARHFKLSLTWQIINALLPFSIIYMLQANFSNTLWLALAIPIVIFIPTFITKVPFYPSNKKIYQAVLKELPQKEKLTFLDAGCGTAAMLIFLAKNRPNCNFIGVEINPLVFVLAKLKALFQKNVQVKFLNLWKMDISHIDILYTFLAPPFMPAIWKKAQTEMNKGSYLLSNSFAAPAEPEKIIELGRTRQNALYVYKID